MSRGKVRIHSGDTVVVISGKDSGTVGRVIAVDPSNHRLKVEGVRVVKRHTKPTSTTSGGIVTKEAFIDVSNVAYFDVAEGRRVKIGFADVDGAKVRIDRKTGRQLDKE